MPKLEENQSTNPNNQTSSTTSNQIKPKEESGLIKTIGQLLPLAPFVFEQFTGQKVPPMSGTMADIHLALQQLQLTQTQIINQQQTLLQRITSLETSAGQQLTSLTNQFNSLRLTHTREKKEIEYNPHPNKLETEENY